MSASPKAQKLLLRLWNEKADQAFVIGLAALGFAFIGYSLKDYKANKDMIYKHKDHYTASVPPSLLKKPIPQSCIQLLKDLDTHIRIVQIVRDTDVKDPKAPHLN